MSTITLRDEIYVSIPKEEPIIVTIYDKGTDGKSYTVIAENVVLDGDVEFAAGNGIKLEVQQNPNKIVIKADMPSIDLSNLATKNDITNLQNQIDEIDVGNGGGSGATEVYFGHTPPTNGNITVWIDPDGSPSTKVNAMGSTPIVSMTNTTAKIEPNIFYLWGEVPILNITLGKPTDNTIVAEYMFQFTSGAFATTLSPIPGVTWYGGVPTILSNKIYQASIINGIGMIVGA